jgi:hypothetical protein
VPETDKCTDKWRRCSVVRGCFRDAAHVRDGLLHHDDEHWMMGVWADANADVEEVFPCLDWSKPIPVTVRTQGFNYHGEGTVRCGTQQEVGRIKRVIIGHGRLRAVTDDCG